MSDVLSIDTLANTGGFATGAPVAKTVQWHDGAEQHEATVYVRQRSYHAVVADIQASVAENQGQAVAIRIANTICDEHGEPIFTKEIITGEGEHGPLSAELTAECLRVMGEVNNPKSRTSSQPT